jgi:hypothetical protein
MIYGPLKIKMVGESELKMAYRKLNILITINLRRLEWTGHLVRMAAYRTVQKVFLGKTGRRRKAGRPNLKWSDSIEKDLKLMDVKRWRKRAEDRFAWAINQKGAEVKL